MSIGVLTNVMIKLLLMLSLGFLLNKKNILNENSNKMISSLVVNVTCPLLVIASVCTTDSSNRQEIIYTLLIGAVIYCLLPIFAKLCIKIMAVKEGEKGTYEFMIIFANTSFMGIPIVQSLFGDKAVFYTCVLHLPFDLLVFSYGVYIILKDSKKKVDSSFKISEIFNIGMILSVLALIIYLFKIQLPNVLVDTMYTIGNVTTPLSMIVLGSSLATIKLKDIFSDKKVYLLSLIRLLIIPIIVYFVFVNMDISNAILGVATITFGMPVASMAVMLSNEYEGNVELATKTVFITTIVSMVTIPIIVKMLLL